MQTRRCGKHRRPAGGNFLHTPIAPDTMMKLKLDFSGSDLPWRVDILDWSQTSEAFRQSISAEMMPL